MTQIADIQPDERVKVESWRLHVLIEAGYLSNVSEGRKIATPSYRQSLAEAVARALE